jgi:SAM-dependent methyltransferase
MLHYGPLGTVRWIRRSLPYHLWLHFSRSGRKELKFDAIHGVGTEGIVEPAQFGLGELTCSLADAVQYAPSKPQRLIGLLRGLPIDYRQFTFVDIGAGKGRVLLLAARFSFKHIIGVEFAPGLAATARKNAEIFARTSGGNVQIEMICADASEYELPRDDLVIYMFNPFNGATFTRFLASLERSLGENPRAIYLLYWSPMSEPELARSASFQKVAGRRDQFALYRSRANTP